MLLQIVIAEMISMMICLSTHGILCTGHRKYVGDFCNVAGEQEMGPLCGILPARCGRLGRSEFILMTPES